MEDAARGRAGGDRGRPRRARGGRGVGPPVLAGEASLWCVPTALPARGFRWRALDLGTTLAFLEADAPRVFCKQHRVVVAAVPWARHKSRFTVAFEDQC